MDAVGAVVVGVRVLLADAPVGGPAGVADAGRGRAREQRDGPSAASPARSLSPSLASQRGEVADGAHGLDVILGDHGDAGAVVAAVLQTLETAQQQFTRRALADVADDSAHPVEDSANPCSDLGIGHLGQWRARS